MKQNKIIKEVSVIHGDKIARMHGYPTANISMIKTQWGDKTGVFASKITLNQKQYNGALVVTSNPFKAEVHLLDYQGPELYGELLDVTVYDKVSDIVSYSHAQELKQKIQEDIQKVRACLLCLQE